LTRGEFSSLAPPRGEGRGEGCGRPELLRLFPRRVRQVELALCLELLRRPRVLLRRESAGTAGRTVPGSGFRVPGCPSRGRLALRLPLGPFAGQLGLLRLERQLLLIDLLPGLCDSLLVFGELGTIAVGVLLLAFPLCRFLAFGLLLALRSPLSALRLISGSFAVRTGRLGSCLRRWFR